jgi:hypothetical protein
MSLFDLDPRTVQTIAIVVAFPPVLYLLCRLMAAIGRFLTRRRRPLVTDRGYINIDQYRAESRERLHELQRRTGLETLPPARPVSLREPAAKGGEWRKARA